MKTRTLLTAAGLLSSLGAGCAADVDEGVLDSELLAGPADYACSLDTHGDSDCDDGEIGEILERDPSEGHALMQIDMRNFDELRAIVAYRDVEGWVTELGSFHARDDADDDEYARHDDGDDEDPKHDDGKDDAKDDDARKKGARKEGKKKDDAKRIPKKGDAKDVDVKVHGDKGDGVVGVSRKRRSDDARRHGDLKDLLGYPLICKEGTTVVRYTVRDGLLRIDRACVADDDTPDDGRDLKELENKFKTVVKYKGKDFYDLKGFGDTDADDRHKVRVGLNRMIDGEHRGRGAVRAWVELRDRARRKGDEKKDRDDTKVVKDPKKDRDDTKVVRDPKKNRDDKKVARDPKHVRDAKKDRSDDKRTLLRERLRRWWAAAGR